MFEIVAAISFDGVIGYKSSNKMPWHIPSDLRHFREITTGNTVVMGHNTYKSIGKVLPNRRNIVITRNPSKIRDALMAEGVDQVYSSLREAVERESFFYLIGGGQMYETALAYPGFGKEVHALELTLIRNVEIDLLNKGDLVYFPIRGEDVIYEQSIRVGTQVFAKTSETDWMSEGLGPWFKFVRLEQV